MYRRRNGTEQWYALSCNGQKGVLTVGYIFTQPDMLDPDRINAEDFELKTGSAIILLEYRVQQSPKTQMYALVTLTGINNRKYIRVSEILIVDSMLHLRSDTPIQCRPPVAQSQLANRENTSSEPMEDVSHQPDMKPEDMDTSTT